MSKIFETPLYPYRRSPDQDAATPVRHPVVVIGAGPVGLAAAIDLAQHGMCRSSCSTTTTRSFGSRAICFAKRPLEILDRLGCGEPMVDKGVTWNTGKVFFDEREVYDFDLLPGRPQAPRLHQPPAVSFRAVSRGARARTGRPRASRSSCAGNNRVEAIETHPDHVRLTVETPKAPTSSRPTG
jgi:3-(3-hydroxy-phenyl)propionate hydroxylase